MNTFRTLGLVSLLVSGIASAAPSCNGFQIKLKNNLADDLLVTKVSLNGADIQPTGLERLKAKTEQVLTVNASSENVPMVGEIDLHSISLPSRTVKLEYSLENKLAFCEHTDNSQHSDYGVDKTRAVNEVQYTISNN